MSSLQQADVAFFARHRDHRPHARFSRAGSSCGPAHTRNPNSVVTENSLDLDNGSVNKIGDIDSLDP
jgi:hypothetical protein